MNSEMHIEIVWVDWLWQKVIICKIKIVYYVKWHSGEYCAFEIKLGIGQIDDAAKNLLKFASILKDSSRTKLQSLNVITGTGISYKRNDGVSVISLASLGYWKKSILIMCDS